MVTHTHKVLGNLVNRTSKRQKDVAVRCSSPVAESSTNYGYASPHQANPTTPSASHHPAMATPNSVMTTTTTTPPSPPTEQMQHFNQRLGSLELHIGATDQRLCRLENVCDQLLDSSTTLSANSKISFRASRRLHPSATRLRYLLPMILITKTL